MGLCSIYLRLSRDEENKGLQEVLHNNRETLIKLAERNNLKYDIYEEVSSGINDQRPELNKLLQNLELYDYILVMDIDRLTRSSILAEQLKQIFIMNDIKILTPTGEINFENESNDLLYSFSSLLANYEYKQIRKRMVRGKLAAASKGKFMGNRVPLGYGKDEDKKLVIIEEETKIIRYIFEKLLEDYSAYKISDELNILQWKTREGKAITSGHISMFKRNPVYYGCVQFRHRRNGKVVEEVIVEDAHEPIVNKRSF
ncbi:recombinase family protein [Tepidibacillus marianensis]|uniref:recombinase family protein n=1 Tax=Tepidibacillus marianensis TaxID=3131995 RepID=UPI0030CF9A33